MPQEYHARTVRQFLSGSWGARYTELADLCRCWMIPGVVGRGFLFWQDFQNLTKSEPRRISGIFPTVSPDRPKIPVSVYAVLGAFRSVADYKEFVEAYVEETMMEIETGFWK